MTEQQVIKRVEYWLKHTKLASLGVSHWDVKVGFEDLPDGSPTSKACIRMSDYYDSATIIYKSEFIADADTIEVDYTTVHEIVHCITRDLRDATRDLYTVVAPVAANMADNRIDHEIEGVVDRVARTIVDLDYAGK